MNEFTNNEDINVEDIDVETQEEKSTDEDLHITIDFDESETDDYDSATYPPRGRLMMYTQKVAIILKVFHSLDAFEKYIKTKVINEAKGERYAMIVHNKDNSKVIGKAMADDHIHLALEFVNAHTLSAIAKKLKDFRSDGSANVQTLTLFKGDAGNMYSYLCHRTKRAKTKFQYDPSDVKANFDYIAKLADITMEVETSKQIASNTQKLGVVLERLSAGLINLKEAEQLLSASDYGRNLNTLRNVWALAMKREADKWRKERKKDGKKTRVIWIWGRSGTGKSSLGRELASKDGEEYYNSGSSRGMWDNYESYQHIALLDECRPDMFETYRDMLSILDNYQERAVAPARYYDRELALDTIIITTVYSPYEFYRKMHVKSTIDEFHQLERRITDCIYMDDYFMYDSYFNPYQSKYEWNINTLTYNPYSETRRGTKKDNFSERLSFDELVHSAVSIILHDAVMNGCDDEKEDAIEKIDDSIFEEGAYEDEDEIPDEEDYDELE